MSTAKETAQSIQTILGVTPDGQLGPKSLAAFQALAQADPASSWPQDASVHFVFASSFADPADLKAFQEAKARGETDEEAFRVGDNCVGKWGDSTAEGTGPQCALPPEDWEAKWGPGDAARHKPVIVTVNGKSVVCLLGDTMPHKAAIQNGAGIDLNPDAVAALGLTSPIMVRATWQWAPDAPAQPATA